MSENRKQRRLANERLDAEWEDRGREYTRQLTLCRCEHPVRDRRYGSTWSCRKCRRWITGSTREGR